MSTDLKQLFDDMLAAIKLSLNKDDWTRLSDDVKKEFEILAKNILEIHAEKAAGTITAVVAENAIDMQENAIKVKLLTIKGLGKLAAENAANAALKVLLRFIVEKL